MFNNGIKISNLVEKMAYPHHCGLSRTDIENTLTPRQPPLGLKWPISFLKSRRAEYFWFPEFIFWFFRYNISDVNIKVYFHRRLRTEILCRFLKKFKFLIYKGKNLRRRFFVYLKWKDMIKFEILQIEEPDDKIFL